MACSSITLAGLGVGCKDSMGGIKKFFAIPASDVSAVTVTTDKITAITLVSSKKFKTYEVRRETSNFTSTINSDNATGTMYVTTEVSMQFAKNTTQKRAEIMALAKSDLVIVALDANGRYWYFGYDTPVVCTGGTFQSGTAASDLNGSTITFTDTSKELPYEMSVTDFEDDDVDDAPVTD